MTQRRGLEKKLEAFQPAVYYESGDGAWAMEFDARGCLWGGGDVFRLNNHLPYRWARGFTRLCQDDHEAPTIPTSLSATVGGINQDEVRLTWAPSTDNRDVALYEAYRDGDLVGTTITASYVDTGVVGTAIYRVRAAGSRGNISATSDPLVVEPPVQGAVYMTPGATWRGHRYRRGSAAQHHHLLPSRVHGGRCWPILDPAGQCCSR